MLPQEPRSAFSGSSTSASEDAGSEVLSTSSYGGESEEEEEARVAVARKAIFSVSSAPPLALPPLPQHSNLPSRPEDELPAAKVTVLQQVSETLPQSDSQFSLPDIPGTSPFLGFEDDGKADSVITLGSETKPLAFPTTKSLQSPPSIGAASQARLAFSTGRTTPGRFEPSPIMASVHRMAERDSPRRSVSMPRRRFRAKLPSSAAMSPLRASRGTDRLRAARSVAERSGSGAIASRNG